MSRLSQLTALGFTLAAALLASAPLMLLADRLFEPGSKVAIATGVFVALAVPVLAGWLSLRLIKTWQPQAMWAAAAASGLVVAGLAAIAL